VAELDVEQFLDSDEFEIDGAESQEEEILDFDAIGDEFEVEGAEGQAIDRFPDSPRIGPAKTFEPGSPEELANAMAQVEGRARLRDMEDTDLNSQTNPAKEFVNGLVGPTTELMGGTMTIATGNPEWMKLSEDVKNSRHIDFERLDAMNATARVFGTALGYIVPGAVFASGLRTVGGGLVKYAMKRAAKRDLIREFQKKSTKYIGRQVAKNPTMARQILGQSAGMMVKRAPLLASEGFTWEYLRTAGNMDAAITGAVAFPLFGTALSVGGKHAVRAAYQTMKAVAPKAWIERFANVVSEKDARMVRELNTKERQLVESQSGQVPFVRMPRTEPYFVTDTSIKTHKVQTAMSNAQVDAKREILQAEVKARSISINKEQDKLLLGVGRLEASRDKMIAQLSEGRREQYKAVLPERLLDLNARYETKILLREKFGGIEGIHQAIAAQPAKSPAQILQEAGVGVVESGMVARRLFVPKIKTVPKSTKEVGKNAVLEARIKKANTLMEKAGDKLMESVTKDIANRMHPLYDDAAKLSRLKHAKDPSELVQVKFLKNLKDFGMSETMKFRPKWWHEWITQTGRWDRVERATGIPVGQLAAEFSSRGNVKAHLQVESSKLPWPGIIKALKTQIYDGKALSSQKAWELFHYVDEDPVTGKVTWNPNAINTPVNQLSKFRGEDPSESIKNLLFKLRKVHTWGHDIVAATGQPIGFRARYVGIKRRSEFMGKSFLKRGRKGKVQKKGTAGLLKERVWGTIPESQRPFYVDGLYELTPRVLNDSINAAAFTETIMRMNSASQQLTMMGHRGMSESMMKWADRALGHESRKDTVAFMVERTMAANPEWATHFAEIGKELAKRRGEPPPLPADINRAAYELMYQSYIGTSTKVLSKQYMQTDFMLPAEISLKHAIQGKRMAILGERGKLAKGAIPPTLSKAAQEAEVAAVKRNAAELLPVRYDFSGMEQPQRALVRKFVWYNSLPSRPGMFAFTKLDHMNRKAAFIGGRLEFAEAHKAGNLTRAMQGLRASERTRVLDKLNKFGLEAGKDEFGKIIAVRVNYNYTMADRAEMFSGPLGRMIPFTTWSVNQWERHIENVGHLMEGRPGPLAKRLGYGFAGSMMLQQIYGEQFMPVQSPAFPGTDYALEIEGGSPQASIIGPISEGGLDAFTPWRGITDGDVFPALNIINKLDRSFDPKRKKRPPVFQSPVRLRKKRPRF